MITILYGDISEFKNSKIQKIQKRKKKVQYSCSQAKKTKAEEMYRKKAYVSKKFLNLTQRVNQ